MIAIVGEGRDAGGESDLNLVEPLRPFVKYFVDHRLDERAAARPAKFPRLGIDEGEGLAGHRQEAHLLRWRRVAGDRVGKPDRLKAAQAFVVHADAARIVDQRIALFQHQRADAHRSQIIGDGQPHRAGADDSDVDRFRELCLCRGHFISSPVLQAMICHPGGTALRIFRFTDPKEKPDEWH